MNKFNPDIVSHLINSNNKKYVDEYFGNELFKCKVLLRGYMGIKHYQTICFSSFHGNLKFNS